MKNPHLGPSKDLKKSHLLISNSNKKKSNPFLLFNWGCLQKNYTSKSSKMNKFQRFLVLKKNQKISVEQKM